MAPFSEGRLRFLEEAEASSVEVPGEDSGFTSKKNQHEVDMFHWVSASRK